MDHSSKWRNACVAFRRHETSAAHREAEMKFAALEKPSVASLVSMQERQNQSERRRGCATVESVVK